MTSPRQQDIPLTIADVRGAPPRIAAPPAPPTPWLFAAAMATSTAVAVFGGLVLGIFAATNTGFARERWTETVQAHGHLQLFSWTSAFVAALAFEFVVRVSQRPPLPSLPRMATLVLIGSGGIVIALGEAFDVARRPSGVVGGVLLVAGALFFAWLILRVRAARPLSLEIQPLFIRTGACWLVVASLATFWSQATTDLPIVPLAESRFVAEVVLRGFVLNAIVGVALRAFPGHLETPPVSVRGQWVAFAGINGSLILWAGGSGVYSLADSPATERLASLALAATLLFMTWSFGVHRAVRGWSRRSERYQVLVPLAWVGLVCYAAGLSIEAIADWAGADVRLLQSGAVRHIFLLGFMAPLMIAMAHIVLARFGTGRILGVNWLTGAFALLMTAWPIRVVPPLVDPDMGTTVEVLMGLAGGLAALGLFLAAAVAALNAREILRSHRSHGLRV